MINKWFEESSDDESESEKDVFDDSDSHCVDESSTKTINSVAPDKFLDNSASLQPLSADFDAESLQKNIRKTVTLHKVYTAARENRLKKGEAISFSILPTE